MRRPSESVVASTSSLTLSVRTTSSRRMTLAGLKKCVPSTWEGRPVAAAMRLTSR